MIIPKKVGICFSKELQGDSPLSHIITKLSVYMRLLELMKSEGWEVYVLTRKTYKGSGIFKGGWLFDKNKFFPTKENLKLDLVYDRTGGVNFPIAGDSLCVVNERDFKVLAWNKWATSKIIGEYMPQTLLIDERKNLPEILSKVKSDWVVLKPFNGLKGIGIFIGPKVKALGFKFNEKYNCYIAQEFVDTSGGIPGLTNGMHDVRIVIVNAKPVWCHIRVPAKGSLLANAAQGGSLTEISYEKVPENIKKSVSKITEIFSQKFDNPVYSLDFGVGKNCIPYVFEINDQMGFPKWEMSNRDNFLHELIQNFREKLQKG